MLLRFHWDDNDDDDDAILVNEIISNRRQF